MTGGQTLLASYFGITPETTEAAVLRMLVRTGLEVVRAEEGSLLAYDEESQDLRFVMTEGQSEGLEKLIGQHIPLGKGITGLAASSHEVQIGSTTYHVGQPLGEDGASQNEPEAVVAAPMVVEGKLVGVITAVSFIRGRRFDIRDGRLYGGFAAIAGLIIDQRRRLIAAATAAQTEIRGSLGEIARQERRVQEALQRILSRGPSMVARVANLLEAVECLAGEDSELMRKGP
jgi:GAF domain-containing protein